MNKVELQTYLDGIANVQGDSFVAETEKIESALFDNEKSKSDRLVRTLSAIGGFLTSIMFTALLFAFEVFNNEVVALILGLIFFGTSLWASSYFKITILETASLGLFLSGVFLTVYGLDSTSDTNSSIYWISISLIILSAITVYFSSSFVFLLFAGLMTIFATYYVIFEYQAFLPILMLIFSVIYIYITYNEARLISKSEIVNTFYNPLKISLILGMIFYFVYRVLQDYDSFSATDIVFQMTITISMIAGIIFITFKLFERFDVSDITFKITVYALIIIALAPTIYFPEVAGSILILLASFYVGHKPGIAISVLSLLFSVMMFYYNIDYTLLVKSFFLIGTGAFFVGAYYLLNRMSEKLNP